MNINDEIWDWEKEAPYLASLPRTTPYRVPDKYFNDLQIHIRQAVFLADLEQKETQGFKVPENYFEELGQQIESRIAIIELENLVTNTGFNTPDHYFEQLQAHILSKTTAAAPKTKIFKLWQSEFARYVSAACFILLAASGLYLNHQSDVRQMAKIEMANEQMLYDIDENVILEHLEENQTANKTLASDTEMENYILNNFSSRELVNNL